MSAQGTQENPIILHDDDEIITIIDDSAPIVAQPAPIVAQPAPTAQAALRQFVDHFMDIADDWQLLQAFEDDLRLLDLLF